jgi:hypothetical protein
MKFLLVLASVGSILGGLTLLGGMLFTKSAIQESASAAYACALAVIPYVLARANQLWHQADQDERRHRELLEALKAPERPPTPSAAQARPIATVGLAQGTCSNCGATNQLAAPRCSSCGTMFGPHASSKLVPLPPVQ